MQNHHAASDQVRGSLKLMTRYGESTWRGSIKEGGGSISLESGVLKDTPYGFSSRFEDAKQTNPEELIGAAHSACFAMALSLELGKAGFEADELKATSSITIEKDGEGFTITKAHLALVARVPDVQDDEFQKIAKAVSVGCPVSKLLNAEITLEATLA